MTSEADTDIRPPLFYPAHGLALLAVLSAGAAAGLRGRLRLIRGSGRIALVVLIAAAAIWAAAAYNASELFSTKVFGATGPFVWLTLIFAMAGMDRRIWTVVGPFICMLAYATTLLAVLNLVRSADVGYVAGYSRSAGYCVLLMWTGGWTLLTALKSTGWQLAMRCAPVTLLFLTGVQSGARSWTIQAVLLGLAFLILRGRDQGSIMRGLGNAAAAAVLGLGVLAMVFMLTGPTAVGGVSERMLEDTRTAQYREFFYVVPISDLLLGRGPKGTWYWFGIGDYQYFDNGFLWTLFIGGVPTFLSYVFFVFTPAIGALRTKPRGADAAAAGLVLFWGLALTGLSTYTLPSVGFGSYITSLWVGRCYLIVAESALQRKRLRQARRQRLSARYFQTRIAPELSSVK